MEGTTAGRGRRALWGTLSLVLALSVGASLYATRSARSRAVEDAGRRASDAARTALAPLLFPKDLEEPITGARYLELSAAVERDITGPGPIESVAIWSSAGRNLFDVDGDLVGTRSSTLRETLFQVANGEARTDVVGDSIRTLTPLWLEPDGTVAVAEMDQPVDVIAAQLGSPWNRAAMALAAALLLALVMYALSFRKKPARRETPQEAEERPLAPRRERRKERAPEAPIYAHPGFAELERARRAAEERAMAAEQRALALQARLEALERMLGGPVGTEGSEGPAIQVPREPEEAMPEPDTILSRLRLHRAGGLEGSLGADGRGAWRTDEAAAEDRGLAARTSSGP